MDAGDSPVVPRDAHGRFMPGNPGRRFGAVGKASARVSRAILADFESHQDELLPRLRRWFMPQYVSLVSRLLARPAGEGEGSVGAAGLTPASDPAELGREIAAMRAMLAAMEAEAAASDAAASGEAGREGAAHAAEHR